jgi:hypothetical protein
MIKRKPRAREPARAIASGGPLESSMLWAYMRRVSKATAGIWFLLALCAPSTTLSQPVALHEKIQDLLQVVADIEATDGANSEQLIDPLTTLGRLYQDDGKPFQSAAVIRRALDVTHVNEGLYTLEQAPLLRLQIGNAEAIDDPRTAWDIEQRLLTVANRHPDDVRTARILRETADRRMEVLDRYIAGQTPPEIQLGCYYDPIGRICTAGGKDDAKRNLLYEAQTLYSQSVNVLLRSGQYPADELQSVLENLAGNTYRYGNPHLGRQSLVFLLNWQNQNARAWSDRIETLVEIADWDLFHSKSGGGDEKALSGYMHVYELLAEQGAQELIDKFFSPKTPIVLPTFAPNPLVPDQQQRGKQYIDVAFDIDEGGKAHHIRILPTTVDAARPAEKQLVQLILRSHFRPRVIEGRFAMSAPVVVRYYVE